MHESRRAVDKCSVRNRLQSLPQCLSEPQQNTLTRTSRASCNSELQSNVYRLTPRVAGTDVHTVGKLTMAGGVRDVDVHDQ